MDFDPKHKNYGSFEYYADEIGKGVFHKGGETINTWFKTLKQRGLIYCVDDRRSLWGVHNPARYIINSPQIRGEANKFQKIEGDNADLMLENIGYQKENIVEFVENIRSKGDVLLKDKQSIAKGSYKDNKVSLASNDNNTLQYEGYLSIDDQYWIMNQALNGSIN